MPINTFDAGAPPAASRVYAEALDEGRDEGLSDEAAHRRALRMVHHSGFYKGRKGWRKLTGDLRAKVQLREAVKQPDGRYVIEGVKAFYPNAVKRDADGRALTFTADDIRRIIANTNRHIEAGGAKPKLTREGHPHLAQKLSGKQLRSYGSAINWREDDKKPGWAVCDLVDVDPEVFAELKERQIPGLSAGFAEDAGGLQERFGHVALLGGESPALALLPDLEVFCAPNQVCFSADTPTPRLTRANSKGMTMKMDKEKAKGLADAFSGYAAALASYAAGEEGCEHKLDEAQTMYGAALKGFNAEGEMPMPEKTEEAFPGGEGTAPAFSHDAETGGSDTTELGEEPELTGDGHKLGQHAEFAADAGRQFASVQKALGENLKLNKKLHAQVEALSGKLARKDFHDHCAKLRNDGFQLPAEAILDKQFANCFSSSDPKTALSDLQELLQTYPKRDSLAGIGPVFGAEGSRPDKTGKGDLSDKEQAEFLRELHEATGRTYSADDIKIGKAFANMFSA